MQFVSFWLDGGALAYFKREDINVIVEDNNSPGYTHIYIRGQERYFKVKGHYREILDDLGIKP
mgnify:CR=1 FL=1